MKIPLNWLKEYVEVPSDVEELTKKLTAIGHMQDKKPEKVGDDTVIDLEVRQNRPDCLSVLGIAREVAAVTQKSVKEPSSSIKTPPKPVGLLAVDNDAPDLCRRFKAYRIKLATNTAEAKTPPWMIDRLNAYGIKIISPLVDITNYVTVELGEPLHAFDTRHIVDNTIVIRRANKDESITILGGKTLSLTTDDLVIASKSQALSLAGMIGGTESGVQADTTEIVLEAATYNQASIRRSSIRHSVRTEASTRHEKFLHPHLAEVALDRAASLILEICGGEIVAQADSYPRVEKEPTVPLHLSEISRLGGVDIAAHQTQQYLQSLGFDVKKVSEEEFTVIVPYWRTDIALEADLVEEVLRLYGYENIPTSLPPFASPKNITSYWFRLEESIRDIMLQLGFDEQITEPLTKAGTETNQVLLQNALNADKNALRTNLTSGLSHALAHQKKFDKKSIKLFELGKVYSQTSNTTDPYTESRQLGFVLYNKDGQKEVIYLTAKGVVKTLCGQLGFEFTDSLYTAQLLDESTVYCAVEIEKNWGSKAKKLSAEEQLYSGIPHFQKFDLSLYLDESVKVGELIQTLTQRYPSLQDIDYVISPSQKEGKKSVLLKFVTSKGEKELLSQNIIGTLQDEFKSEIR